LSRASHGRRAPSKYRRGKKRRKKKTEPEGRPPQPHDTTPKGKSIDPASVGSRAEHRRRAPSKMSKGKEEGEKKAEPKGRPTTQLLCGVMGTMPTKRTPNIQKAKEEEASVQVLLRTRNKK
jgi:hypothetical protein